MTSGTPSTAARARRRRRSCRTGSRWPRRPPRPRSPPPAVTATSARRGPRAPGEPRVADRQQRSRAARWRRSARPGSSPAAQRVARSGPARRQRAEHGRSQHAGLTASGGQRQVPAEHGERPARRRGRGSAAARRRSRTAGRAARPGTSARRPRAWTAAWSAVGHRRAAPRSWRAPRPWPCAAGRTCSSTTSKQSVSQRRPASRRSAPRTWSCHHWPGADGVAVAEAEQVPVASSRRGDGPEAGPAGVRGDVAAPGWPAARAGSPSPRRRRPRRRRAARRDRPGPAHQPHRILTCSVPSGPSRSPPGHRPRPRTAKRANSSSAYHRSAPVSRRRRPVRRAGGTRTPRRSAASRHRLTVPCQPERRLADAERGPAARARRAGRRPPAAIARQNGGRPAGPQPGPGQRQHRARRRGRRPGRRTAAGPDHRPGCAAGAGRAGTDARAIRAQARPTGESSKPAAAAGASQHGQRRPPGQVGVARAEAGAGPGAEQLGEPHAGQCAAAGARSPAIRPQRRRGTARRGAPATRAARDVASVAWPRRRSRHLGRGAAGDPDQLVVGGGEDRLRHPAGGPDLVVRRPGRCRPGCAAGRGWPTGATPPIAWPVCSRTNSGVARRSRPTPSSAATWRCPPGARRR